MNLALEYMRKIVIAPILILLFSCSKSNDVTEYTDVPVNTPLVFNKPSNFPSVAYDFQNNPPTKYGFELGKKLFYDGRLASDGAVSCGFCHIQENAFTHHGHTVSEGVNNQIGKRNTPPIQNMAFQTFFMWDGAANHLDLQPMIPFTSPIEMNGNFDTALNMMRNDAQYKRLFELAFADKQINSENMLKAIGQFMAMAVSANSRFDKYKRNEPGGTLTQEELDGYAIFNSKCTSCHASDIFTDNSFRNNGLSINPSVNDIGRYRVTLLNEDKYKFKVPSLRNIEVTAPYMHDGRFATLDAVLNHYSSGVTATQNLDPLFNAGGTLGIPLIDVEKTKIIAFLKTLTDNQFLTDKRFSEF